MLIDQVNLNHLRIFESVYRTRSMTLASKELHLTQSGVSQHIKSLEEVLGVQLFDRINQRIVPTRSGAQLYTLCSKGLSEIEQALFEIKGLDRELSGMVVIGMPMEFGNNIVMPKVAEFAAKHPKVRFAFKIDFASAMNEMLLKGEVDFAFVDTYNMDRRIQTERVYDEILQLCIRPDRMDAPEPSKPDSKYFEQFEYVAYQEGAPLLKMWFDQHLKGRPPELNVRATVMDVQGMANLILLGVGAGILPGHLVHKLARDGQDLAVFQGCGKPVKNTLSVAYLEGRTQTPAAREALEFLKKAIRPEPAAD